MSGTEVLLTILCVIGVLGVTMTALNTNHLLRLEHRVKKLEDSHEDV